MDYRTLGRFGDRAFSLRSSALVAFRKDGLSRTGALGRDNLSNFPLDASLLLESRDIPFA